MKNYLLTNQNTRVFNVDLAKAIGLNEAIVLQQIQYWIEIKENEQGKYQDSIQDGYVWVYNTFENWNEQLPFWCIRTVKTIFKNLENKGILVVGNYNKMSYDKTKWYRIDYDKLEKIIAETLVNSDSAKIAQSEVQKLPNRIGKNCTTNTKEYSNTTTEITDKCNKGNFDGAKFCVDFSYKILEKQIKKCSVKYEMSENAITELTRVVFYYFDKYDRVFNEKHPNLSNKALNGVIQKYTEGSNVVYGYMEAETYFDLIDKHFKTEYYNCDYNICHFFTDGVLDNRAYECCL